MDSAIDSRGRRLIRVYEDIELLSMSAAAIIAEAAINGTLEHGCFSVLLSGGNTPRRTYELLSQEPFNDIIPWDHVHIFWGDERCVPEDDPRNNAFAARNILIDKIPIPETQVHPVKTGLAPSDAAADYEMQLRRFFSGSKPVFDLVILGLGEDGHTASLFPGRTDYPENKWVVVTRKQGEDIERISLTPALINMASKVLFLVSGKNKSTVLQQVLYGPFDPPGLPAQLIKVPDDRILWLVDNEASCLIKPQS